MLPGSEAITLVIMVVEGPSVFPPRSVASLRWVRQHRVFIMNVFRAGRGSGDRQRQRTGS